MAVANFVPADFELDGTDLVGPEVAVDVLGMASLEFDELNLAEHGVAVAVLVLV